MLYMPALSDCCLQGNDESGKKTGSESKHISLLPSLSDLLPKISDHLLHRSSHRPASQEIFLTHILPAIAECVLSEAYGGKYESKRVNHIFETATQLLI